MTHERYRSDQDPSHDNEADIISFEDAARERPRKTDVPVEAFLLSEDGREEMNELYATIDDSDRIVRTLSIEIGETLKNEDPNIYSLFIHDDGAQALTRPELIDLYRANPLINSTIRAVNRKHHSGDFQAKQLYTFGLRIFMNMVRYEWLTRTYDPEDPLWTDRALRLGNFHGSEMHLHLKPGHRRQEIIPRQHTPSDYLDLPLM